MDIEHFWKTIESVRESGGNVPELKLHALRALLEQMSPEDVVAFEEHFDACEILAYRWDLWAAAYLLHGGCSDDMFSDFCASLICQGRDIFESAVANPDSLANLTVDNLDNELFFEGYQYVPHEIYKTKTGGDLPPRRLPFPSDPVGEEWEDKAEDFKRICPQLWEKHGWADG